jgi:hypothetical protein
MQLITTSGGYAFNGRSAGRKSLPVRFWASYL